jgi:LysM repeat protein
MSACLVLAWCILPLVAVAGLTGPGHLVAQPSTGTAVSSTATSVASSTRAVLTSASAPAATTEVTAARRAGQPAATWTVRPGDTLSAVAAALGVPGGWPALYAANKAAIGPDPGLIRPGTVLALPGAGPPARYTVAPGDTLSAVAAALGVPGGWPALYAANKQVIGPDPDLISAGTVLAVPHPPAPAAAQHPAPRAPAPQAPGSAPASPPLASAGSHPARQAPEPAGRQPAAPGQATAPGRASANVPPGGMPRWLQDVLLAAGVLAATAFIAEPAAALARRRRGTARPGRTRPARDRRRGTARPDRPGPASKTAGTAAPGGLLAGGPGAARAARRAARKAKIILADHERLIVTYCAADHAVYVLTPPGEDPRAVLRAARLVLPEDTYEDLAGHLGVPSAWPLE